MRRGAPRIKNIHYYIYTQALDFVTGLEGKEEKLQPQEAAGEIMNL